MLVYDLTPFTGREAVGNRTVVIQGKEVRWRTVIWLIMGLIPSILVVGLLLPFLGSKALFALPLVEGALLLLFVYRTNDGLRLTPARTLRDLYQASEGTVFLCDEELDLRESDVLMLMQNTVPVAELPPEQRPVHLDDPVSLDAHLLGDRTDTDDQRTAPLTPPPAWTPANDNSLRDLLGETTPRTRTAAPTGPVQDRGGVIAHAAPPGPSHGVDQQHRLDQQHYAVPHEGGRTPSSRQGHPGPDDTDELERGIFG